MQLRRIRARSSRRGAMLVSAVVVVMVAATLSVVMTTMASVANKSAETEKARVRAQYMAEGALTRRVAGAAPRICLAPLRYDLDDRRSRDMSLRRYESKRRRIPRGAWETARNVSC